MFFLHNCHVIKEQKGILLVIRRTGDNDIDPQEYTPCIYCLGFIKKRQAFKHVKSCVRLLTISDNNSSKAQDYRSNSVIRHSKTLLELMANPHIEDNDEWTKLKVKLNDDLKAKYIIYYKWGV